MSTAVVHNFNQHLADVVVEKTFSVLGLTPAHEQTYINALIDRAAKEAQPLFGNPEYVILFVLVGLDILGIRVTATDVVTEISGFSPEKIRAALLKLHYMRFISLSFINGTEGKNPDVIRVSLDRKGRLFTTI